MLLDGFGRKGGPEYLLRAATSSSRQRVTILWRITTEYPETNVMVRSWGSAKADKVRPVLSL